MRHEPSPPNENATCPGKADRAIFFADQTTFRAASPDVSIPAQKDQHDDAVFARTRA